MAASTSKNAGFTLLELLAGATIFAVIMALLLQMLSAFEVKGDLDLTSSRLQTIVEKAGEYYLSRENLPVPTSTPEVPAPMGEVPLAEFHLDAKYRIDSWGRPIQYFSVRNDGVNGRVGEILIDPLSTPPFSVSLGTVPEVPEAMVTIEQADLSADPPTGRTLINGVQVNGRAVAGILISSGPNNVFEYNNDTPPAADAYPVPFTLDADSDDIIMPIDLHLQATKIAQAELRKLGEKVRAFDDRYIGKNNDGDGFYDENFCAANAYPGPGISITFRGATRASNIYDPYDTVASNKDADPDLVCQNYPVYPGATYLPNDGNDYSCGRPTLDYMQEEFCDTSIGSCDYGYYLPDEEQWDYDYERITRLELEDPDDPGSVVEVFDHWEETEEYCGRLEPDYYRVPMIRGNPDFDDCHWGLVGDPDVDPSKLTNDQARAFIYCVYSLSPADIVDPWLNGYVWGSGETYADPDPRYQKFFSAGPDETADTDDDIVAPL